MIWHIFPYFQLEAKNKANATKIEDGREEEISEYELKKQEKLKNVEELREKLRLLKEKVGNAFTSSRFFNRG